MRYVDVILTGCLLLSLLMFSTVSAGILVDHTSTDLSDLPETSIEAAKSNLHIVYYHTSHGSQLISGMQTLKNYTSFGDRYAWSDTSTGNSGSLSLDDQAFSGNPPDLSQGDRDSDGNSIADWADFTSRMLEETSNHHINVVMWSWCNIAGHDINRYLDSMEWLLAKYGEGGSHPRAEAHPVSFVFMTGHANGDGQGDSSDKPNQQIREHCKANDRILFDFADIENYDPDGNYFLDKRVDDALNYDRTRPYDSGGRNANWASEYLTRHPSSELATLTSDCGTCSHSPEGGETQDARLNCVLKGRAAWNLFANIAESMMGGGLPRPQPGPPPPGKQNTSINLLLYKTPSDTN